MSGEARFVSRGLPRTEGWNGAAAPVFPGDVVVIDATHATVAEAWVADTFPANVTNVRVAKDFTFHSGVSAAIFGGVTVAVDEGVALTLNNSGSQNSITLGAVTLNGPGSVAVTDTIAVSGAVSGMAALTISGTVNVASGGSIANAVSIGTLALTSGEYAADAKLLSLGGNSAFQVGNVSFEYGADYATATVTATVSDTTATYTLSVGNAQYAGTIDGSTVTFSGVATGRAAAYDTLLYSITAADGEYPVTVSGGSGPSVAADTTSWFSQSSANSGVPVNGSWTTAVNLSTPTNVTDNTFTTTESTSSRVVLEFNVCFSSVSDADVDGDAQGALKLGEVNSVTTFMVLTNGNQWAAVSNVGLTPDPTATNKVVMTFDYANNTYSVSVDNYELTDGSGSSSFPLAASRTGVKDIDFAGTGTLVSMKGDQVEGYMVVDKYGTRYPSIAAAISAYTQDPSIGPLKLLHSGTPPSGWRIDGDTLIKVAKGLFFMAF